MLMVVVYIPAATTAIVAVTAVDVEVGGGLLAHICATFIY